MKQSALFILTVAISISSCRNVPVATAVKPSIATGETSVKGESPRTITAGDPQNNSAVAVIMNSSLGGEPGLYISKQMDVQAENIGQTEMKGARILRIGEGIKITFDGSVMFAANSSTLSTISKENLDRIATSLVKHQNTRLVIEGHTDGNGAARQNQALSLTRADAVRKYLGQRGVEASRIQVVGYGEQHPLFSNDSSEGRTQNRRVEVIIVADDKFKQEAKTRYQQSRK